MTEERYAEIKAENARSMAEIAAINMALYGGGRGYELQTVEWDVEMKGGWTIHMKGWRHVRVA